MKASRAPDGTVTVCPESHDPPGLHEFWYVAYRRLGRKLNGTWSANTDTWKDAEAVAELRAAFLKDAGRRGAVGREKKRAARGDVVTGWSNARIEKEQIYRKWSDKVCSGGKWTKGRAALSVTNYPETGNGHSQAAKIVRRSIELEKHKGRKVVEWPASAAKGQPKTKRFPPVG